MEKILISACLLGAKVRYHGKDACCEHPLLRQWMNEGRLVAICPEVSGGATVPRPPSEIIGAGGGGAVLKKCARVINNKAQDVTAQYQKGAELALQLAKDNKIKIAILKDRSPSCGSSQIYDGSFSNKLISQEGVTAALLRENGIKVFSETAIEQVAQCLRKMDADQDHLAS